MSKEHIGGVNIDPSLLRRSDCESEGSMSNPMYRNLRNSGGLYLPSSGRYIRRRIERLKRKEMKKLRRTH